MGRGGIDLSHLQFMDDTILFHPANWVFLKNYRYILDYFGIMSGLRINYVTLIPINYDSSWVQKVEEDLKFMAVSLPMKYLVIPFGANLRKVRHGNRLLIR